MKLNSESGQKIWESHLKYKKREVCPFPRHTAKDIIQTVLDFQKHVKLTNHKKKTLIPGSYERRQKAVPWLSLMSKEQSTKRGRTSYAKRNTKHDNTKHAMEIDSVHYKHKKLDNKRNILPNNVKEKTSSIKKKKK